MRIFRILAGGAACYAVEEEDRLVLLEDAPFRDIRPTKVAVPREDATILAPVTPSKVIGVGANFPGDAPPNETVPSVFLMPPSAIAGPGELIVLPDDFGSVLAEGELGVVVRRRLTRSTPFELRDIVLGYTCVNDFSLRDATGDYVPPLIKKGADGLVAVGPCIFCGDLGSDATVRSFSGPDMLQEGKIATMTFGVKAVLSFLNRYITLEAGDLLTLGTPVPKPRLVRGDKVSVEIESIGRLENEIV